MRGDVLSAIRYFENHLPLMKYWAHVQKNLPIGSGVVSSPQVVCLNQIGETGTIGQRLYMKGDSNEHAQER